MHKPVAQHSTANKSRARILLDRILITAGGAIALLLLFWAALAASYAIPSSMIQGNVEESRQILREETLYYKQYTAPSNGISYDNFTVYIMLNLAVQPADNPFVDAVKSKRYDSTVYTTESFDYNLTQAIEGRSNSAYPRYWHGYLVFLRPLLVFFNVIQIRLICQALFFILLSMLIALLTLRKGSAGAMVGVLLMASYVVTGGAQAVETLPIFPSFFLSASGSLVVLYLYPKLERARSGTFSEGFCLFCLFGAAGALTVYFDFLDNPVLALCIPLAIYIFCRDDISSVGAAARIVALAGIGWCVGYVLLWAGKWVLAGIVTGQSVIEDALDQAAYRSGATEVGQEVGGTPDAIRNNILWLGFVKYIYAIACVAAIASFIVVALRAHGEGPGFNSGLHFVYKLLVLLVISAIPYIWYAVLANHSIVHAHVIAFRTQIGALFPWLLITGLSIMQWRKAKSVNRRTLSTRQNMSEKQGNKDL